MTQNPKVDFRAIGNPWHLRRRQCEVLDAYVAGGCAKRAAQILGISDASVTEQMTSVRHKMNVLTVALALIQWDRYRRGDSSHSWGVVV
jgi:FixJ family two-component response regulator